LRERGMNDVERALLDDYRREVSRSQARAGSEQE
jgi:hypothetical protein